MEQRSLLEQIPEPWQFPRKRTKRYQSIFKSEEETLEALNNEGHNIVAEDFSDSPYHKKEQ